MKVYRFTGSYQLEVVIAESEEKAWEFLTTHDGTAYLAGTTLEDLKAGYSIDRVFDLSSMTEAECAGHYSG